MYTTTRLTYRITVTSIQNYDFTGLFEVQKYNFRRKLCIEIGPTQAGEVLYRFTLRV